MARKPKLGSGKRFAAIEKKAREAGTGALSLLSGNRLRLLRTTKLSCSTGKIGPARNTWKPRKQATARLFRTAIQTYLGTVQQHTGCRFLRLN